MSEKCSAMEDYYFIPVLDKNVGRILSEESISPPAFYADKKNGAIDYFFHEEIRFPINYNLAFNGIDELIKSANSNAARLRSGKFIGKTPGYFIFFGFPSKYFKGLPKWKFGDIEVIKVSKTLYLNPQECLIIYTDSDRCYSEKYKRNIFFNKQIKVNYFSLEPYQRDELLDDSLPNEEAIIDYKRIFLLKRFIEGFAVGSALKAGKNVFAGCLWIKTFLIKAKLFEKLGQNIDKMFLNQMNDSQVNSFILEEIESLKKLIPLIDQFLGVEDTTRVSFYSNPDYSSEFESHDVKSILESYLSRILEVSKYRHVRYKFRFHRDEVDSYNNELLRGFEWDLSKIVRYHSDKVWSSEFMHKSPFVFERNRILFNDFFSSEKEEMYLELIVNELVYSCSRLDFPLTNEEKHQVLKGVIEKIHSAAKDSYPEDLNDLEQLRLHFNGELNTEFKQIKNNIFQALYFIYEGVVFTFNEVDRVIQNSLNGEFEYELYILETLAYYFPLKAILNFDSYSKNTDMILLGNSPGVLNSVSQLKYSLVGFDFEPQDSDEKMFNQLIVKDALIILPRRRKF